MNGIITIGFQNDKAVVLCNKCGKPVEESGKTLCRECEAKQPKKPMSIEEKLKAFRNGGLSTMGW